MIWIFKSFFQTSTLPATLAASTGFAILLLLFYYGIFHRRNVGGGLPPGPYPYPVIGNLYQLRKPVHRVLKDLAHKYGPIMFLRLGSVPTVVVSSSEMAKQFLKVHDAIFANRPATAAGKYYKGLKLYPYGDHWRQIRKLCVSALFTAKRVESFKYVREEEVSEMIRSIWEESQNGTIAVNVSKATSTLTSNVIWRILAGRKFSDNDLGADAFKGFKDLASEKTATLGEFNIGDFIPYLDWLDLQGIKRRMMKVKKTFDPLVEKIIDERLPMANARSIDGQAEAKAERVKDFVDVLLQISSEDDHKKGDTKAARETIKATLFVCR